MNIKNRYIGAKKIIEIAIDGDHPNHEFVAKNISLYQAIEMQVFIKECEDQGIKLINNTN